MLAFVRASGMSLMWTLTVSDWRSVACFSNWSTSSVSSSSSGMTCPTGTVNGCQSCRFNDLLFFVLFQYSVIRCTFYLVLYCCLYVVTAWCICSVCVCVCVCATALCSDVCLSFRHVPVLYWNDWMDWVGFRHRSYPRLILHCVVRESWYLQK